MNDMPMPDKLPRIVLFRGRKARVIGYDEGKFEILDYQDQRRLVTRDRITFIKQGRAESR